MGTADSPKKKIRKIGKIREGPAPYKGLKRRGRVNPEVRKRGPAKAGSSAGVKSRRRELLQKGSKKKGLGGGYGKI